MDYVKVFSYQNVLFVTNSLHMFQFKRVLQGTSDVGTLHAYKLDFNNGTLS